MNLNSGDMIHYIISETINLGNYSSMRIEFGIDRQLIPGEDAQSILEDVVTFVEEFVASKVKEVTK